ncbi:hypothetical protein BH11MYX3_BH11MYX3_47790 [soil metagenome]
MANNESTAINDLIHLVQGRVIDDSDRAQDGLFVTAVPLRPPMPAPLPRRRAPNATPPAVRMIEDFGDDDDSATKIDHVPRPIVPQYAFLTPAPLPSVPYHASLDATERVEQYDPIPVPVWAARAAPPPPPLPPGPFDDHLETVRVDSLPAPLLGAPRSDLRTVLGRLALPFAGLAVVLMFVGGYVVHNGQGGHKREVPIVMAVSAPTPPPAPVVTAIVEEAPPTVTSTGEAIGWKPTAVQPTFVAAVVAPPEIEPEVEIDATPIARPHRASKPVAKRPVARVARSVRPVAAPAAPRARRVDPVAVAIADPVKPEKSAATGTGPGKLTITSTPSALIYVDGRSTNQMTPKTLTLAPGNHKITLLEISSRKAKTQEVELEAGGSAQIAKTF